MCAQFLIRASAKSLAREMGAVYRDEDLNWEELVVPQRLAPVVVSDDIAARHLTLMRFGLIPSWSKESKVKFATHNARLLSEGKDGTKQWIYDKPTWRGPFAKRHCLVPVEGFVEPIYSGEYAGFMVKFCREDQELLVAAGIWDTWVSTQTGEVIESFSIVTSEPLPVVEKVGHDRSPLFLKEEGWDTWLTPTKEKTDPKIFVKTLQKFQLEDVALEVEKFRPMKKGWEKRA